MALAAVMEDVRALIGAGTSWTEGTDLFAYEWGVDADGEEIGRQVLVRDDEPIDTDLKDIYEQPVVSIIVRGESTDDGKTVHDLAREIYEFMLAQNTQTINGIKYLGFEPVGGLIPLGRDKNERFGYSMTFFTYRNPT